MEELNNKVHNLAFDVAFLPLKCKINSMSSLQVRMWQAAIGRQTSHVPNRLKMI